ncbi:hypothetical protein MtrunA17_Chr3g0091021 [Medicago truncatula]|uniref:Uncharacterized protein n=1 Tax=Medicago truncatula TaxID=3880 RepID=A0A396IR69_MEDTR|nr:hypothetical protein MtrunA17_Chr3g0091021 [Medicago truncatula]
MEKMLLLSPSEKCHKSVSNILTHLISENFLCKRIPNVFRAKGKPPHFSTILIPMDSRFGYSNIFLPSKACLTNKLQESLSSNCLK